MYFRKLRCLLTYSGVYYTSGRFTLDAEMSQR